MCCLMSNSNVKFGFLVTREMQQLKIRELKIILYAKQFFLRSRTHYQKL